MGQMTDDLDRAFITEITSNGAKTYAYKTKDGNQGYGRPKIIARAYIKDIVESPPLRNNQSALSDLAHKLQKSSLTLNNLRYIADLVQRIRSQQIDQ